MAEDLKTLKTYLLEVSNELNRRDYEDYLSYLKSRYFLLKDYSSDKEKALDTSITDYTEAIAELDKLIYVIQSRQLVDIEEINLDFEAWRLSFDGTAREQENAELALERYRNNKNTEIKSSIEKTKAQISILNQLIVLLESTDLSNEAIEYRIRILKDIIEQSEDLLGQLNRYYNL